MQRRSLALPALLLLPSACDDTVFEGGGSEAVEGEGIDAVVEIFDANCVVCHSDAGAASAANLSLEGDPCETLVGVDAVRTDGVLVVTGDHESSVLWQRMVGAEAVGGVSGIMPPGADPEDEAQVANAEIVAAWIDEDAATDCETGR